MTDDTYENDDRRISRAIGTLTQREVQVLDLISFGNTGKAVAKELKISPRTVEVYRQRALDKLGARNTVDMVRMFVQHRIRNQFLPESQRLPERWPRAFGRDPEAHDEGSA